MSMKFPAVVLGFFLGSAVVHAGGPAGVTVHDRPPVSSVIDASGSQYVGNRPPLAPSALIRLPPGTVRPQGWLHKMVRLQADGFHGRLQELSRFVKKEGNAWLDHGGKGHFGWEEMPYWLKGYINCAYVLKDEAMIREAHSWIEGAIKSQQADGWFGPGEGRKGVATDLVGREDLWPNMIMLFCLQDYYEYTGDRRVIELMTRYFRHLEKIPEERFLVGYWPKIRGGDQLYSILWLYNRTGDKWLLDVAHKTHRCTARWDKGLINGHNVNIAQGFREPATYALLSGKEEDRQATLRVWNEIRTKFGQVPGGMYGADENTRVGYTGPRQAIETCGMVEEMLSDELLIAMTADPAWAESCENVAFNSLPAAFTADMKALRYLTSPNLPQSDHVSKSPGVQNGGPMFHMNPHDHRCCQHNCGQGWPYFVEHLWYATADNGLAAYLYGPCQVKAKVAGGVEVTIEEKTRYPFEDNLELVVTPAKPVAFPLYLRIPGWCPGATLAINGQAVGGTLGTGKIVRIERAWKAGDKVDLKLPMPLAVKVWHENRGTVSVNRGPLTYSLLIKEKYVRHGGTDVWPAWDIYPTSPWNYGLVLSPNEPDKTLAVETGTWPDNDEPFTHETPVKIKARAKRLPNWTLDRRGLVQEVIPGPVKSSEPVEEVTLIPMGAARLRISAFPLIGEGSDAKDWPGLAKTAITTSASHCYDSDSTEALCDGILPRNSADHGLERFTWWPHKGTVEWVQYDFLKPRAVDRAEVYWFQDQPRGGCKLPTSWRLLYRAGKDWKPVPQPDGYPLVVDRFCTVHFQQVMTDGLRLEVQLEKSFSGGLLEWRVGGNDKISPSVQK